jgi:hypothetical protein
VLTVSLTECEYPARDAWYAGLDSLRGLRLVDLISGEELVNWLRPWLPGTEVVAIPF